MSISFNTPRAYSRPQAQNPSFGTNLTQKAAARFNAIVDEPSSSVENTQRLHGELNEILNYKQGNLNEPVLDYSREEGWSLHNEKFTQKVSISSSGDYPNIDEVDAANRILLLARQNKEMKDRIESKKIKF